MSADIPALRQHRSRRHIGLCGLSIETQKSNVGEESGLLD